MKFVHTLAASLLFSNICLAQLPAGAKPTESSARKELVVQVAQDSAAIQRSLDKLSDAVAKKDLDSAESALRDVRQAVFQTGLSKLDEPTIQRVLQTRFEASKLGCQLGSWKDWGFDGKSGFDSTQQTYIDTAEDHAYKLHRVITNSEAERASEELEEFRKVLQKPAFQSDPVLKSYFDTFATTELTSLLSRLAALRLGNMQNEYHFILDGIKNNNLATVNVYAPEFKKKYYRLRNDGFDTSTLKISSNTQDPLADKITLDAALKGVNQAMLTVKAIAAQEKARQAAYLQEWKTMLHGDRARVYAQNGIPTRFQNCLPDYRAGAADKSSWWLYYSRQDKLWLWETTYRFNAQGSLVDTQKVRSFFPQN